MNEENNGVNPVQTEAAPQSAAPVEQGLPQQPVGGVVSDNVNQVNYVSNGTPMPKKKGPIKLIIGLLVIAALVAVGYFVVYPYFDKKVLNKPIDSFNTSIDTFTKNINNTVSKVVRERQYIDAKIKLESNMDQLKAFDGYTFNVSGGIDPKKKNLEAGFGIGKGNENLGAKIFYVNGDIYAKLSTYSDLFLLDKLEGEEFEQMEELFGSSNEVFEILSSVSAEDSTYLVNLWAKLLKESIPEDKIVSEDATMDVLGDTVNVTSNKLVIDEAMAKNITKHVVDGIKNDSKAIEILKKLGLENPDELFAQIDSESIELEENITVIVYTLKGENVGYELAEGEDKFIYYKNNGNFVIEGTIKAEGEDQKIKITGKKDGGKTNVSVKNNGKELISLVVSKWEENEVDLSYSISGVISGDFKASNKQGSDKSDIHIEFKLDMQGQYVKISADIVDDWSSDIPTVNVTTAKQLTDEELAKVFEDFSTALQQSSLFEAFESISGDLYYDMGDYNLNDYKLGEES